MSAKGKKLALYFFGAAILAGALGYIVQAVGFVTFPQ